MCEVPHMGQFLQGGKNGQFANWPIGQDQLKNQRYIIRFGHTKALLFKKKWHEMAIFPALQKLTHMWHSAAWVPSAMSTRVATATYDLCDTGDRIAFTPPALWKNQYNNYQCQHHIYQLQQHTSTRTSVGTTPHTGLPDASATCSHLPLSPTALERPF